MKRRLKAIPILLIILMLSSTVLAEPIKVMMENNYLQLSVDPVSEDGRTLVPLRAIFEAMGATVDWEQTTKTITGTQGDKIIILQLNNKIATVNGKEVELDVPAKAINGSTLVPIRFIAESLGAEVDWDQASKTVLINSNKVEETKSTYKVTRVVDGDTIIVDLNGVEERVRLIGIDTPESVHPDASRNLPEGKVASEFTKSRLEGKEVKLEFDVQERDQYGRLLAYVYIDGAMFNKTLLIEGYARTATYPPNVKYVEKFTEIQRTAREGNKGLWSEETFNSEVVPEVKTSGTYVGSLNSDKYHKPTCRHAKNIESFNETWFDTSEEAGQLGYSPCGVCKP